VRNIIFIINGTKKRSKKLKTILYFFSNSAFFSKVDIQYTNFSGHAEKIAMENCNYYDFLIAVGGDGTLNEIINGIDLKSDIIVGLLPFGTANDFSRGQNLHFDANFLFELIKDNHYKSIDVGLIEANFKDTSIKRRFINIADIGLGGFITLNILKNKNSFLSGKIKYGLAILKGMMTYSKDKIVISGDYSYEGKVLSLAVCNSPFFGHGLCISPEANVQDNFLNITCVGNVSLIDYLRNLRKIRKGLLIDHPEINYGLIQNINISHINIATPIEVDGEFIGYTPASIEILQDKIKFLLP